MSRQQFPTWVDQPGSCFTVFEVTGGLVSTGAQSTAGLDGRGANFCTVARAANVYTFNFLVGYPEAPYVFFSVDDDNVAVSNVARTGNVLILSLQERDDATAAVNTATFSVQVMHFDRTNFVS